MTEVCTYITIDDQQGNTAGPFSVRISSAKTSGLWLSAKTPLQPDGQPHGVVTKRSTFRANVWLSVADNYRTRIVITPDQDRHVTFIFSKCTNEITPPPTQVEIDEIATLLNSKPTKDADGSEQKQPASEQSKPDDQSQTFGCIEVTALVVNSNATNQLGYKAWIQHFSLDKPLTPALPIAGNAGASFVIRDFKGGAVHLFISDGTGTRSVRILPSQGNTAKYIFVV